MKEAETKDRIKEALELRGMKQADLVEKTGIDKGQMSSYLSGRYKPKQANLHLIACALSVDEAWLMGYDVPMEKSGLENRNNLGFEEAFHCQLKALGWSYTIITETSPESEPGGAYALFKNENLSFRVSGQDFTAFIRDSESFFKERLQQLLKKSMKRMFAGHTPDASKSYLEPVAAHIRTDIKVTDEMCEHDDNIMDNDEFWNK